MYIYTSVDVSLMQPLTHPSTQPGSCPTNHNYPVNDLPSHHLLTHVPTSSPTGERGVLLMLDNACNRTGRQSTLRVDREQVGGRHALVELVTVRFCKSFFLPIYSFMQSP